MALFKLSSSCVSTLRLLCIPRSLFQREMEREREREGKIKETEIYAHIYDIPGGEWKFAGRTIAARVRAYHAFDVGVDIDGGGRRGQERPRGRNTKAELHICVWGSRLSAETRRVNF